MSIEKNKREKRTKQASAKRNSSVKQTAVTPVVVGQKVHQEKLVHFERFEMRQSVSDGYVEKSFSRIVVRQRQQISDFEEMKDVSEE